MPFVAPIWPTSLTPASIQTATTEMIPLAALEAMALKAQAQVSAPE